MNAAVRTLQRAVLSARYKEKVASTYAVAYALKFLLKKEQGVDYTVMPLEGLWWTPDVREFSVELVHHPIG